jgi:hypothetical protein
MKGQTMARKRRSTRGKKKTHIDQGYLKSYCNLMPDPLDPRDYPYVALGVRMGAPAIPKRIDYSKETKPVGDQGYSGSCVGWARRSTIRSI